MVYSLKCLKVMDKKDDVFLFDTTMQDITDHWVFLFLFLLRLNLVIFYMIMSQGSQWVFASSLRKISPRMFLWELTEKGKTQTGMVVNFHTPSSVFAETLGCGMDFRYTHPLTTHLRLQKRNLAPFHHLPTPAKFTLHCKKKTSGVTEETLLVTC